MKETIRINDQITSSELRVIGAEGENIGVISKKEAIAKAEEVGLDLIEIAPTANPPVAKIMDYGKYQYLEKQRIKQTRASSHTTETKSLQVKIGTGDHDLELKAQKAAKFLKEGHRIKIELFLPGRAKYFEKGFLNDRLERLLKLIPEEYKVAEEPKKNPKGLYLVIERANPKKTQSNENK